MGGIFGKKPKAPKGVSDQMSPNPVDPGPPPGDLNNLAANGAIADAATRERLARSGKGYQSTLTNKGYGYSNSMAKTKRLTGAVAAAVSP